MTLQSMDQLAGLTSSKVWINASGLGAGQLASDDDVIAIRGQTMFVKSDRLNEAVILQGSQYTCDPTSFRWRSNPWWLSSTER